MKIKILIMFFVLSVNAKANLISYDTTYAPNGQVTSTNLNGNFNNVKNVVNGSLDNNNANTTSGYRFYQTVALLPAAGSQGAVYFLTTDNSLNFDTGSAFNKSVTVNSPVNGDMPYYNSGWNRMAIGTNGQAIISNGTVPAFATLTSSSISGYANTLLPFIKLSNTQSSGVSGGTATSGAWRVIGINTTDTDTGSNVVSNSGGTFVLTAGTYDIDATNPFHETDNSQIRLQNTTAASTLLTGESVKELSSSDSTTSSRLTGRFTVAAAQSLQLQYQVGATHNTDGIGLPSNFGSEVYAQIKMYRVN